jgi:23S rRNA (uracil1939-C5)-methyltransferase
METIVTPDEWMTRGETRVRGDGKSLVVWSGIPGEPAKVKIYGRGQHQDRARFLAPAGKPDPKRRKPPCDKYDRCGGCPIMHLKSKAQSDVRLRIVHDLFADRGLGDYLPTEVVQSPDGEEGYRYVTKMVVGKSDWGHTRMGAYGRDSHDIIPIPKCHVITPQLRAACNAVAHHVIDLDIFPYEEETGRGVLRYVVMRQSRVNDEILLTLVTARRPRILHDLAERLTEAVPEIVGVHVHVNSEPGNAIYNMSEEGIGSLRLEGRLAIEEKLAGVRLQVGPGDFFQANPGTADLLVSDVVELLKDDRDRPVVDLYSGVGTFTLALAKHHGWGIGIESVASAVLRARENAQLNHIKAEFLAGPVESHLYDLTKRLKGAAPVVVMDPSRRGLDPEVIDAVVALEPARAVYVSCNPASLARDLVGFLGAGWTIAGIKAYDMFPQTSHLELVADLRPPTKPEPTRGGPRRRIVR